jgi:hypothetical protein
MQNSKSAEAENGLDKLFSSPNHIIEKAKKYQKDSLFKDLEREIPYYYFVLKNFIAVHESNFGTIPVQIYNEHRMALDHFVRAKTSNYKEHINSAIGHLRRAVLEKGVRSNF